MVERVPVKRLANIAVRVRSTVRYGMVHGGVDAMTRNCLNHVRGSPVSMIEHNAPHGDSSFDSDDCEEELLINP